MRRIKNTSGTISCLAQLVVFGIAVVRGSGSRGPENGRYVHRETALMFPIVWSQRLLS